VPTGHPGINAFREAAMSKAGMQPLSSQISPASNDPNANNPPCWMFGMSRGVVHAHLAE
jgi:hypothetical protein